MIHRTIKPFMSPTLDPNKLWHCPTRKCVAHYDEQEVFPESAERERGLEVIDLVLRRQIYEKGISDFQKRCESKITV